MTPQAARQETAGSPSDHVACPGEHCASGIEFWGRTAVHNAILSNLDNRRAFVPPWAAYAYRRIWSLTINI